MFSKQKSILHGQRWKSAHVRQGQWWGACHIQKKMRDGEGKGCRDVTVIHSWMCWLLLHMDLPWNAVKITGITILHQCYFHFMFARFGFLSSMKWRSHQLLKPPLIILPSLCRSGWCLNYTLCFTHTCICLDLTNTWLIVNRASTVMVIIH